MVLNIQTIEPLFEMVERTRGVTSREDYHPESDVLNHSLQTLRWAFRESTDTDLILSALLHDVGKAERSYGHDEIGADMISDYVSDKTYWLVKNHMRFWYFIEGDMRKYQKVLDFGYNKWFSDLAWLCRWDKMGRNPNIYPEFDKEYIMDRLNLTLT